MPKPVLNQEYYGVAGYNAFVLGKTTDVCKLPFRSKERKWWFDGFHIAKTRKATRCITKGNEAKPAPDKRKAGVYIPKAKKVQAAQ